MESRRIISRRSFLRNSALTVGGIAGLNLLAAYAPTSIRFPTALAATAPQKETGGRLIIALDAEPVIGIDPQLAANSDIRQMCTYISDSLPAFDLTYEGGPPPLRPGLATSWTLSPDGKTYTFKLRQGVKFHDGTPFDAQAAKLMFDRLTNRNSPYFSARGAANQGPLGFNVVKGVRIEDPLTLVVELEGVNPEWPRLMALGSAGIVSPAALAKWSEADIGEHPVGTGPFVFTQWKKGQEIVLTRNPNYWGTPPKLSEVVIRFIPDANTRVQALLKGEVHFVPTIPPGPLVDYVQRVPTTRLIMARYANLVMWQLNCRSGPTADKRVRQALNYAVNRDSIVKLLRGLATPARGFYAPGNPAHTERLKGYSYDPAKAKQLLDQAGHSNGFSFNMKVPGSVTGWPLEGPEVWQLIQANLRDVGITVNYDVLDGPAYQAFITPAHAETTVATVSWSVTGADLTTMTPRLMASGNTPPRGLNRGGYSNPEVDKLFGQIDDVSDFNKRIELFQKVNAIAVEDAVVLFLYNKSEARGVRADIEGMYAPQSYYYTITKANVPQ